MPGSVKPILIRKERTMKSRWVVFTLVSLVAVTVSAQRMDGRHHPASPIGSMGPGMAAMDLLVAPDGTIIVEQTGAGSMPMTAARQQVVAISPSGAAAWSWSSDDPIQFVSLANTLIVVASGDMDEMHDGVGAKGALTALSLSTGRPAWTLPVGGIVMNVIASSQQIYVVVVKGTATSASRTLLAISNSGVVLWSKVLVP
jgi:outer membrane protein assembly factor BamB